MNCIEGLPARLDNLCFDLHESPLLVAGWTATLKSRTVVHSSHAPVNLAR